jgi:hypothetical protein
VRISVRSKLTVLREIAVTQRADRALHSPYTDTALILSVDGSVLIFCHRHFHLFTKKKQVYETPSKLVETASVV